MPADPVAQIRQLLNACTPVQREEIARLLRAEVRIHQIERDWNTSAEVVLEALHRAGELTQRMFKGILAEAAFKVEVVDNLADWDDVTPPGDPLFDFKLRRHHEELTIQVKLQRKAKGVPLRFRPPGRGQKHTSLYVVETQKTRSGKSRGEGGGSTRPYRFGDFDVLAVSVEPTTNDWAQFRYTVGDWLLPRPEDPELLAVLQPVSIDPSEDWTDSLDVATDWWREKTKKTIRGTAED